MSIEQRYESLRRERDEAKALAYGDSDIVYQRRFCSAWMLTAEQMAKEEWLKMRREIAGKSLVMPAGPLTFRYAEKGSCMEKRDAGWEEVGRHELLFLFSERAPTPPEWESKVWVRARVVTEQALLQKFQECEQAFETFRVLLAEGREVELDE